MRTDARALGALTGLALGDALGMPTQSMSKDDIRSAYGQITGLRDAIADQPIAPAMAAGHVTDDTEQALLLADQLINGDGHVDPLSLAADLLRWEDSMRARGSHDLLGPSTKLALEQLRNGAKLGSTGTTGTTNGAAMRVTPVGIAHDITDADTFTQVVRESCMVTHNTTQGFQSAALVAAAVSYGVNGADTRTAVDSALQAVEHMPSTGSWSPRASVLARTRFALQHALEGSEEHFEAFLRDDVGTSVEANESIPAALALVRRHADEPFQALLQAAALGGDTDTIAAISGAILGATNGPGAFPTPAVEQVRSVSGLDINATTRSLLALRSGSTQN